MVLCLLLAVYSGRALTLPLGNTGRATAAPAQAGAALPRAPTVRMASTGQATVAPLQVDAPRVPARTDLQGSTGLATAGRPPVDAVTLAAPTNHPTRTTPAMAGRRTAVRGAAKPGSTARGRHARRAPTLTTKTWLVKQVVSRAQTIVRLDSTAPAAQGRPQARAQRAPTSPLTLTTSATARSQTHAGGRVTLGSSAWEAAVLHALGLWSIKTCRHKPHAKHVWRAPLDSTVMGAVVRRQEHAGRAQTRQRGSTGLHTAGARQVVAQRGRARMHQLACTGTDTVQRAPRVAAIQRVLDCRPTSIGQGTVPRQTRALARHACQIVQRDSTVGVVVERHQPARAHAQRAPTSQRIPTTPRTAG
jgi:hypothetical protein